MNWLILAVGIAIGVFGYLAYDKYFGSVKTFIAALETRLANIEKKLGL